MSCTKRTTPLIYYVDNTFNNNKGEGNDTQPIIVLYTPIQESRMKPTKSKIIGLQNSATVITYLLFIS